jgi:hypothetical protein
MSEAEEAWVLWRRLQKMSEALWNRYESAFMDFCGEEQSNARHSPFLDKATVEEDGLPF